MIIIISSDQKFIKFCADTAECTGYISINSNYEKAVDIAVRANPDVAVIHSSKASKISAKECASALALRKPEIKILAAVEKPSDSPSLYFDIEGIHRQVNLPCSSYDLQEALSRLYPSHIAVKHLNFGNGRKDITLLNERMRLSKTDYAILRLAAKAYPSPIDVGSFQSLFPTTTKNGIAVHISSINKAAARIIERRLIIFKNGYVLNEFM